MNYLQFFFVVFSVFALSRVMLRYREGQLKWREFLFWSILFLGSLIIVIFPDMTTKVARLLGIGRGADLVVYLSIVVLFYLIFRSYVMMEDIRHEITELVRGLALKKVKVAKQQNKKRTNKI